MRSCEDIPSGTISTVTGPSAVSSMKLSTFSKVGLQGVLVWMSGEETTWPHSDIPSGVTS